MGGASSPKWPPEMLAQVSIVVRRGEDTDNACRWALAGDQFRDGEFSLRIARGPHPDEPVLAEFGDQWLSVERSESGVVVACTMTAEQIAQAQGPRRPAIEFLAYTLCHDGERLLGAHFIVMPVSAFVEARRAIKPGATS